MENRELSYPFKYKLLQLGSRCDVGNMTVVIPVQNTGFYNCDFPAANGDVALSYPFKYRLLQR